MQLNEFLFLAAFLFCTGVYGVLAKKNAVLVLMSIELILNAVNINLIAFGAFNDNIAGQVFALFVIAVAAAEVGVGLAIVLLIYRNRKSIEIERVNASVAGRPDLMAGRTSLTLYEGMKGISENVFINVKNTSLSITADVDIPQAGAKGVIIAQAGRFGGWSLYLKDGKPTRVGFKFVGKGEDRKKFVGKIVSAYRKAAKGKLETERPAATVDDSE